MVNQSIEIVKTENGIYLLHKGASIKDRVDSLVKVLSTIADNPNYSTSEKSYITETGIADYRSLSQVLKNMSK